MMVMIITRMEDVVTVECAMRFSCDDAVVVIAGTSTFLVTRYCGIIDVDDSQDGAVDGFEGVH